LLCAGLEAGIEGAIHSIQKKAAEDKSQEYEEWEIVDDLWRSEVEEDMTPPWEAAPSEEVFQGAVPMVTEPQFLFSWEGVTQGCLLGMLLY
jgi:hypothetical protein